MTVEKEGKRNWKRMPKMYQTSRENLIKVREFLEDIYMYLNNINNDSNNVQQHDSNNDKRQEVKRKELIENCKHIQSLLELEFHPHDDDDIVDSTSYLDMNGANKNHIKCTISDENEMDATSSSSHHREEYIEMSKRKSASNSQRSENPYNIYEATITLSNQDFDKCPFTGLPAVHLKLMCSPITGLLTRLEKKLFFGQSKDFYAGILDKWILLYPSKSNDMKPSEHFYPKSLEKVKGENQFVIVTNNDKRFHFQAPNSDEYSEWLLNINRIIEEIQEGKITQMSQMLSRKLPSPPTDRKSKNEADIYYSFEGTSKSINSNEERLYEEPCSASVKSDDLTPPKLPAKIGKKSKDEKHPGYDTPKSTKVLTEREQQQSEPQEQQTDYDVPRVKVSEMTAILSSINLVSPEEKRKSSGMLKTPTRKSMEMSDDTSDVVGRKDFKSPVTRWFRKRIMRGKRFSQKHSKIEEIVLEEDEDEEVGGAKGSKVNMIINQLEKTGQLKALKKGLKSRKSLVYDNNEQCESVKN